MPTATENTVDSAVPSSKADPVPRPRTAAAPDADRPGAGSRRRATERRPIGQPMNAWLHRLPLVVLVAELVTAAGALTIEAHRLWFFGDDWEFLLNRRLGHDPMNALFYPHNEHWSTLPILVFRALFSVFGVKHYLPYALVVIGLHVAVCVALWMLLRVAGASAWVSVAVTGIMAFLGAGAENTLWDFQMGFVGSVVSGLVALMVVDRPTLRGAVLWSWVPLIAGLMCSGMGVTMCAAAGVWAAFRRGWHAAIGVLIGPGIAYLIWYAGIGHNGTSADRAPRGLYLQVPRFFWNGLTNVYTVVSAIPASGAVMLLGTLFALFLAPTRDKLWQLSITGFAGAAVMFLSTGLTRIKFGVEQATAGRYVYVAAALLLPSVAWMLMRLQRMSSPAGATALALTVGLIAVNGLYLSRQVADQRVDMLAGLPQRFVAAEQLVSSGHRLLSAQPDPALTPDITIDKLARPDVKAALPHLAVSDQDLLDAEAFLEVGVSATPYDSLPAPTSISWNEVTGPSLALHGCTTGTASAAQPFIDVTTGPTGGMIQVTTTDSRLLTQLFVGPLVSATPRWMTTPGAVAYVGTVAPGKLRVILPSSGSVTVCTA